MYLHLVPMCGLRFQVLFNTAHSRANAYTYSAILANSHPTPEFADLTGFRNDGQVGGPL